MSSLGPTITSSSDPAPPRSSPPFQCEVIALHGHGWHFVGGQPGGSRASLGDSFNCGEDAFPYVRFVGTNRQLHFHFIGNDVVLGPAVNGTNSDDNGIEGIVLATRDRLPLVDHFRSQHDRVFGSVDIRAVTAKAVHGYLNRIDIRGR